MLTKLRTTCRRNLWMVSVLLATGYGLGCRLASADKMPGNPLDVPPAITTTTHADTPVDTALVDADNDFGFRLFGMLAKQGSGKNLFMSPSSIALALDMVSNGARGDTRQELMQALGMKEIGMDGMNRANAALIASLKAPDPRVQLSIANALWAKPGLTIKPDFLQVSKQFYGAEVYPLRSEQEVNAWVSRHTNQKIKQMVSAEEVHDASTILIDAIYFKGLWTEPFKPTDTKPQPFTLLNGSSKMVPMMHQSSEYSYYQKNGLQAVSLPYGKQRMNMVVILPDRKADYPALLGRIHAADWKQLSTLFRRTEGTLALPRFRTEYEADLNSALKELGMKTAFQAGADFAGIAPGLKIDHVKHKAFLEVTEEGTEAAAATSIHQGATAAPPSPEKPFQMVVDHPFLCLIVDSDTGAVLFLGSIVDPM